MFHHQLAEAVEDVCVSVVRPSAVLIASVEIEKLIANCKLGQQHLMAVVALPMPEDSDPLGMTRKSKDIPLHNKICRGNLF